MTALVNMLVYIYIYKYSLDFVLYDFYIRLCLYRFLFELSNIRAKLCRVIFTLRYGKISVQERNARNCNFFFFWVFVWQYFRGIWSFSTSHERKRNSKFVHLNKSMYLTK